MIRRYAWVGVVVLLAGLGLVWWYTRGRTAPWRPALTSREIATRVLAEYLSDRFPEAKALVIGNPFSQRSGQDPEVYAFEQASIEGLKKGFGISEKIKVAYPELRPEFFQQPQSVYVDPKTTTPLSYLVAPDSFQSLVRAHPGFDVVISLIGLPIEIQNSELWRAPRPRLALILPDWRLIGGPGAIRHAVESGKIAAAVINRPGAPADEKPSREDYRDEFNRRFLLVTKESVDELLRTHPQLF